MADMKKYGLFIVIGFVVIIMLIIKFAPTTGVPNDCKDTDDMNRTKAGYVTVKSTIYYDQLSDVYDEGVLEFYCGKNGQYASVDLKCPNGYEATLNNRDIAFCNSTGIVTETESCETGDERRAICLSSSQAEENCVWSDGTVYAAAKKDLCVGEVWWEVISCCEPGQICTEGECVPQPKCIPGTDNLCLNPIISGNSIYCDIDDVQICDNDCRNNACE